MSPPLLPTLVAETLIKTSTKEIRQTSEHGKIMLFSRKERLRCTRSTNGALLKVYLQFLYRKCPNVFCKKRHFFKWLFRRVTLTVKRCSGFWSKCTTRQNVHRVKMSDRPRDTRAKTSIETKWAIGSKCSLRRNVQSGQNVYSDEMSNRVKLSHEAKCPTRQYVRPRQDGHVKGLDPG